MTYNTPNIPDKLDSFVFIFISCLLCCQVKNLFFKIGVTPIHTVNNYIKDPDHKGLKREGLQ